MNAHESGATDVRPTVLVAGFEGALGTGIRDVLGRDPRLRVIDGKGSTDPVQLVAEHRPAAALVNHDALANVVDVRRAVVRFPWTRLAMAVMRLNRERDARLLDAGVRVVFPITIDGRELCGVLHLVAMGLVGPSHPAQVAASGGVGLLTEREAQVMGLLVLRRSAREIAEELHVTEATVNTHRRHIYEKLGVHSRAELAQHASRVLSSGRRKEDFARGASREAAPFRRRARTALAAGRPTSLDMCQATGLNGLRIARA